ASSLLRPTACSTHPCIPEETPDRRAACKPPRCPPCAKQTRRWRPVGYTTSSPDAASACFFERLPHSLVGDVLDVPQGDESLGQQTQRPAGATGRRLTTGQGDQVCLLVAIQ